MPNCWKCSKELSELDYGRQEICPGCRWPTRVCMNCVHYDRTAYNECREPAADRVVEKEKGNFCDYFKPGTPAVSGKSPAQSAKEAAEALFKKLK